MLKDQFPPRAFPETDGWRARVSMAIAVARVALMFGIVTGHALLLRDFFHAYAPTAPAYPTGPEGLAAFLAGLAGLPGLPDKLAFAGGLIFWSFNFAFYALSGFSLWYATRRRGSFSLRDYFVSRFFGIYLGFAVAAFAAFVVTVGVFGHKPGEHDLNFLLLGVARARETMDYNDTLWFLTVLFVLYLVFPVIPVLYRRLRVFGLLALWGLFTWMRLRGVLVNYSFLPTAFSFFLLGVVAAEVLTLLGRWYRGRLGPVLLTVGAAGVAVFCLVRLHALAYGDLLAAGSMVYDTHAIGTVAFFLILSLGLLLPAGKRWRAVALPIARGTFAVYVYHYLLFQLYNHAPRFHDAVLAVTDRLPGLVHAHLLVGALLLYGLLLAGGMAYQAAFDRFFSGPLRRLYDQPIVLETRKRRQEVS